MSESAKTRGCLVEQSIWMEGRIADLEEEVEDCLTSLGVKDKRIAELEAALDVNRRAAADAFSQVAELEKSLGIANGYLRKGVEIDDQLKADIKRLRKLFKTYGDHLLGCERNSFPIKNATELEPAVRRPCSCGFDKALEDGNV